MANSIRKGIINYARIIEELGAPYEKLVNEMPVDNSTWRFSLDAYYRNDAIDLIGGFDMDVE